MEEQLNQVRKIEAVGQLAGAVAHDYNNLLTVIRAYTDLALEEAPPDGSLRESLCAIFDATERSIKLTRQLLLLARKTPAKTVRFGLNTAVEDMLQLLRTLAGSGASLLWRPAPEPVSVTMDPTQLDQLLTNLVANARDAMQGRSGSITISADCRPLDEVVCSLHVGCAPGDYVLLEVSDEGCGMTPDVRARIFEPFFTTKPKGKGTGMGLSTVLGIAQQNKGFVEVDTAPLRGTTFRVFLPAACDARRTLH